MFIPVAVHLAHLMICRATVFRKTFCQIRRPSLQNSVAYHGKIIQISWLTAAFRSRVKLSFILFRNFSFSRAGWHSGIVLSYASDVQRKWPFSKVQSVKSSCTYLRSCRIKIASLRPTDLIRQFSLIFPWYNYVIMSKIVLLTSQFWTLAKFRENSKILLQRENATAWLEILRPWKTVGPNDLYELLFLT